MKRQAVWMTVVGLALLMAGAASLAAEEATLEIGGFADFLHMPAAVDEGSGEPFRMGQAEVDLNSRMGERVEVAAALAFGGESFELGALTVDFRLVSDEGVIPGIGDAGLVLGQFDVPFGIDYEVYASIDRNLITPPLAAEATHAAWNDYGAIAYLSNSWMELSLFGTNGFGFEAGFDMESGALLGVNGVGYDPTARADYEIVDFGAKAAMGGRWGVSPLEIVEVGGSYAGFLQEGSGEFMALYGADLQVNLGPFEAKGELIDHEIGMNLDESRRTRGYYGQGLYRVGRHYLVARYGGFDDGSIGGIDQTRVSVGGGWTLLENCVFRLEHRSDSRDGDQMTMQVAVGF